MIIVKNKLEHCLTINIRPVAIRDIKGKGKGLVATRSLKEGEVVLQELPLLVGHLIKRSIDTKLTVRTCQAVAVGEEVVVDYYFFDNFPTREERLTKINNERLFMCRYKLPSERLCIKAIVCYADFSLCWQV